MDFGFTVERNFLALRVNHRVMLLVALKDYQLLVVVCNTEKQIRFLIQMLCFTFVIKQYLLLVVINSMLLC